MLSREEDRDTEILTGTYRKTERERHTERRSSDRKLEKHT